MNFITDNYIWFIVIGIIVLMAVIGYIADKTDFGRKIKAEENEEKPKKTKKLKEEKKETKIKVEPKGINELSQKLTKEVPKETVEKNNNLQNTSSVSQPVNNENIDQSLFEPLTDKKSVEPIQEKIDDNDTELKSVEPAKLENSSSEPSSQTVAEDEDIWKF